MTAIMAVCCGSLFTKTNPPLGIRDQAMALRLIELIISEDIGKHVSHTLENYDHQGIWYQALNDGNVLVRAEQVRKAILIDYGPCSAYYTDCSARITERRAR